MEILFSPLSDVYNLKTLTGFVVQGHITAQILNGNMQTTISTIKLLNRKLSGDCRNAFTTKTEVALPKRVSREQPIRKTAQMITFRTFSSHFAPHTIKDTTQYEL